MKFIRQGLISNGFQGFVTIQELRGGRIIEVPSASGVYAVLREIDTMPAFLSINPGGWFKGKDPTVPYSKLMSRWVSGAHVVYIGKGDDNDDKLQGRVKKFISFGGGAPVAHLGGRLVWQIEDSSVLVVAWKRASAEETAANLEARLQKEFKATYHRLPFANLRQEKVKAAI